MRQHAQPESAAAHPPVNAFSIDLEDYFHTEVAAQAVSYADWDGMPSRIWSSVLRLLDLLDEHHTRSTVFVLGWVARKYPSLIRQVAARGHEIGCHSHRHRPVFRLDRHAFYQDTKMAVEAIEDATGAGVTGYRAPCFSITPGTEWAFEVLAEHGFLYDSSVHPVRHTLYGNPGAPRHPYIVPGTNLLEVPIATWRVGGTNLPIGGGAYLRILPYRYIRAGLEHVNRTEGMPATIYMHPWEIDSFQPPLGLGWKSHARQNWGVRGMEARLADLLSSFRFAPIGEVYSHLLPAARPSVAARPGANGLLTRVAN